MGREWKARRVKPTAIQVHDRLGSLAASSAGIGDQPEPEASGRESFRLLALTIAPAGAARRRAVLHVAEIG